MSDQIPVGLRETYGPRSGSTEDSNYQPTTDDFIIDIDIDFVTRPITPTIHLVQYDYELPVLAFHLYSNRAARALPSSCVASIRINNGNGTVYVDNASGVSADRTTVYFKIDSALCVSPGFKPGIIELSNSQGLINSSPFSVEVDQNPVQQGDVESDESYISLKTLLDETEKWREEGSTHLTNNSYIVTGKATATDVGNNSTAEGYNNSALAQKCHAEGTNNTITSDGTSAHAEGSGNSVSGASAHAEGSGNTASGSASHSEGNGTTASGVSAHSEGNGGIASGANSHAEGKDTTAEGAASHAEGDTSIASAANTHAEGDHTTASGAASHAEGSSTTASGENSHAEGRLTTASGDRAHAEGMQNTASGDRSHAGGAFCTASGDNSFAHGLYLNAPNDEMAAFGKYNTGTSGNLFEIGCGTGTETENRRNALWVDSNGFVHLGAEAINTDSLMWLMRDTTPIILPPNPHGAPDPTSYHAKGKIDLTTETPIAAGASGVMTGTLTGVCPDTIYETCYRGGAIQYGKRFPKHAEDGPNYFPFFNTIYIKNTETGTYRKVLEVGTTYSFDNYDSSTNTFDLTVNTQVINLSSDTPINSSVVIRKSIWAMCYPDMDQS